MRLYFAGPDVFRPDAASWADHVRHLCASRGCVALIPTDGSERTAEGIYQANLRLIAEADALVVNLNPFRGAEPDSGTCVEVGYALALGKPVFGYAKNLAPLRQRLNAAGPDANDRFRDDSGWLVEDFGLPLNLMLAVPVKLVEGGVEECLQGVVRANP